MYIITIVIISLYVKGETSSEHTGRHDMQVLRNEENVYYDDCERKVYATAPYLAKHLSCVSVAHDPCARVTIINDETLPYLAYYGPADHYKTSSESQQTAAEYRPGPSGFCANGSGGEGRRGAFEEKPHGTRFLRTRRTVRGTSSRYFCAGRPVSVDAKYERNYRRTDPATRRRNPATSPARPPPRRYFAAPTL